MPTCPRCGPLGDVHEIGDGHMHCYQCNNPVDHPGPFQPAMPLPRGPERLVSVLEKAAKHLEAAASLLRVAASE